MFFGIYKKSVNFTEIEQKQDIYGFLVKNLDLDSKIYIIWKNAFFFICFLGSIYLESK
jgi:hypothetical protein